MRGGRKKIEPILRAINAEQLPGEYDYSFLADEYGNSVYKFCRSLTYSKEDAEDLFQETFLNVFLNMKKVRAAESQQSFLFSTALYIWKGWKRKYARRKRIAFFEPLDETVASGDSTEETYIEQDELRLVRKLVDALPEKYKIPAIMYYSAELNTEDIALALKLPAGTVKSRLFKARKLVEKGLRAYEK